MYHGFYFIFLPDEKAEAMNRHWFLCVCVKMRPQSCIGLHKEVQRNGKLGCEFEL